MKWQDALPRSLPKSVRTWVCKVPMSVVLSMITLLLECFAQSKVSERPSNWRSGAWPAQSTPLNQLLKKMPRARLDCIRWAISSP